MLRDLVPIRINKHTFHVNNAIYEFYADEKTVRLRIRLSRIDRVARIDDCKASVPHE